MRCSRRNGAAIVARAAWRRAVADAAGLLPAATDGVRVVRRLARRGRLGGAEPPLGHAGPRAHRTRGEPDCGGDGQPEREDDRGRRATRLRRWQECASKARIIYGGRFHPESCRLIRKLTSGSVGQLIGSKPRDKGRLGRPSDSTGRNASEVRAGLERVDADADPPFARGRPRGQGSNRHAHLSGLPGYWTQHVGMVMRVIEGDPSGSEVAASTWLQGDGSGGCRTGSYDRRGRVTPAEGRTLTSGVLSTWAR